MLTKSVTLEKERDLGRENIKVCVNITSALFHYLVHIWYMSQKHEFSILILYFYYF